MRYHADICEPPERRAEAGEVSLTSPTATWLHLLERAAEAGEVRVEALAHPPYHGRKLARNVLPAVGTVGFWDIKRDQDWGFPWHRNQGIKLSLLEHGSGAFAVDRQVYRLQPGDLTVTRPWQPHYFGDPHVPAGRLYWLILDVGVRRPHQRWKWPSWLVLTEADRRQLTKIFRHSEQAVWHANAEIRRCFGRIGQAVETDRSGSNVSGLTVYLNELFLLVLEMLEHNHVVLDDSLASTRRSVELFLADLCQNLDNLALEWTLRSMAKHCSMSVTHFRHYCKELTNMTPVQFLNYSRVEAASKLLLEQSHMNVTEVALACGFSSGQYFATVFRRHMGCSPQAFRTSSSS